MSVNYIGDPSLGLNAQALAILSLLSKIEPEFAEWDEPTQSRKIAIRSYAWYNGRENGVTLTIRRELDAPPEQVQNVLVLTFGECRSSDNIFVQQWVSNHASPPTVEEFNDRLERGGYYREEFPPYDYGPVLVHILDSMRRFYEQNGPAVVTNVHRLPDGNLRGFR